MGKILVVEDDETNREILSRFLKRDGHEVLLAENGREGVAMATGELPDLILMDLSLPEMDGWEATRRIKGQERTSTIPIVVLTAHALTDDVIKAMQAGCDHYETKPVVYPRLMRKIRGVLGEK
jgi:CheY-like chemotaxis protein